MTLLLREAVGERLRRARTDQSRTLREVSRAARVSLGYLSEVERGRKEASSELLGSICGALDLPLPELLVTVAGDLDGSSELVPSVVEQPDARSIEGGTLVPSLVGGEFVRGEVAADQLAGTTGASVAETATAETVSPDSLETLTEADAMAASDEDEAQQDLRLQPVLSQRISAPVRSAGGVVVAA
ncbi:helix-turn-helix domain-containing protein [Allosaccharopolyspora coralli]|uniref:Helix-turn-helix domain-containing protein n=1 Tax=Allosaccharopolyspora coralli TaxID=2665642 RepID=A0A5Q3QC27_9PSEU|nr:helix-turn-helix transcriptional regulator [Allosaccharopolyspora coralli]QGK70916.1 helix-turn-helix domain-containing protein [Allosaccharopolyspora coralli]